MAAIGEQVRRFMKIFDSQRSSKSYEIPLRFNEYFPDPLPINVELRDYYGRSWTVGMTKRGAKVFLTVGWEIFAKDNNLEDGKWIQFIYDRNRTFYLVIFYLTGCSEHRDFPQVVLDVDDYVTAEDEDEDEEEEENINN